MLHHTTSNSHTDHAGRPQACGRRGFGLRALVTFWTLAVVAGMACLWDYESAPGYTPPQPDKWPTSSKIERNPAGFTLVMFAHPHCPCTRASLGELHRLLSRTGSNVHATVTFLKPVGVDVSWCMTDLWQKAKDIPQVRVTLDPDAREARLFGAGVSGHTALFDSSGNRVFSGGITPSRGHEGNNNGRNTIERYVLQGELLRSTTCAYGCPLYPVATDLEQK